MKTVLLFLKTSIKKITFYQVVIILGLLFNPLLSKSQITLTGGQPFTPGTLVVLCLGNGTTALSAVAAPLSLVEYTDKGDSIQSVIIPNSGSFKLTTAGSSTGEGYMSLSQDGYYLTIPGYDAVSGTTGIATSTSATANRKLFRIDNSLNVLQVASTTAFSGASIRGGTYFNNNFWATGSGGTPASAGGLQYFGTGTAAQITTTNSTNLRAVAIFNNQLYYTTGSGTTGLYSVGTGMPTAGGITCTLVVADASPYCFSINPAGNICYLANDAATGGIRKFTKTGTTWSLAYTLSVGTSVGARGLTVDWNGPAPIIYATTTETSANKLVTIIDNGSTSPFTILATSSTNKIFRGVTFSPASQIPTPPVVSTGTNNGITSSTATCYGSVTSQGSAIVTKRGFCYSTVANPDTNSTVAIVSGVTGNFLANLTGLSGSTTYHYRAFAQNAVGVTYGHDSTFTTSSAPVAPVLTTDFIQNITTNSAQVYANVINDGGSPVLARGVCWSTTLNPTIINSFTTETGTTGSFSSTASGLNAATSYHVRAYATNAMGTSYGSDLTFTTIPILPTYTIAQVKTENPTTGIADSVNVNCRVYGIVHGLNYLGSGSSFFIMDSIAGVVSGISVFNVGSNLGYTPVTEGDLVRVIGKITNYNGLIEISADSLVKISSGNPTYTPIYTTSLSEANESVLTKMDSLTYVSGWPTANANANVNVMRGSQAIVLRVYGLSLLYTVAAPTGMFSLIGIGGQFIATSPYIGGFQFSPRYKADVLAPPNVTTNSSANITPTSADCYGNVTYDWGSTVITRGICYSTNANPTIAGNHIDIPGTIGIDTAHFTQLLPNTVYHYRAYATNSNGIAYGSDLTFMTSPCVAPTSPPTNLMLVPGATTMTVFFNAPIGGADHYLIVKNTTGVSPSTPINGVSYSANNQLTGSSFVSYQTDLTFTDSGLNLATQYFYFVYSVYALNCYDVPNYYATPLSGFNYTYCTSPALQPTNLTLTPSVNSVSGTFTHSNTADHYLIIRSTSDTLIATPLNGTIYDISSAYDALGDTVVAYQSNTSFTNNGLNPATKYYYYIFAANYNLCTNGPVYLAIDPLKDSVITNCAVPTVQPTNLILTSGTTFVLGSFAPSANTDHYLIIRSTIDTLSAFPHNDSIYNANDSLGGGLILGYQTGVSISDNELAMNTQYFYFIFASNSTICSGGPTYLTTSPLTASISTLPPQTKTLKITAMLQEYYNTNTGLMNQTLGINWDTGDLFKNFTGTTVDTVMVLIRKTNITADVVSSFPIDTVFYGVNLNNNGLITISLSAGITGYHFIEIKHRNSIETWSDSVDFSTDTIKYDFYNYVSQFALDNGMLQDGTHAWIWGGDVNQNGNLESEDATIIYVAANSEDPTVNNGYVICDIDGNGNLDSQDYGLAYNNANIGANIINPFSYLKKK